MPRICPNDMELRRFTPEISVFISPTGKSAQTEYTIIQHFRDETGSVFRFCSRLWKRYILVEACQKTPELKSDDTALSFNTNYGNSRFNPLSTINVKITSRLNRGRNRTLWCPYSSSSATLLYAKLLTDQDFMSMPQFTSSLTGWITNSVIHTGRWLRIKFRKQKSGRHWVHDYGFGRADRPERYLAIRQQSFGKISEQAHLTQYVDAGDATPKKLAKLAQFVSQSIASQSQSLGTGAASQPLTFWWY